MSELILDLPQSAIVIGRAAVRCTRCQGLPQKCLVFSTHAPDNPALNLCAHHCVPELFGDFVPPLQGELGRAIADAAMILRANLAACGKECQRLDAEREELRESLQLQLLQAAGLRDEQRVTRDALASAQAELARLIADGNVPRSDTELAEERAARGAVADVAALERRRAAAWRNVAVFLSDMLAWSKRSYQAEVALELIRRHDADIDKYA